jgi:Na+-driven multidrug efflux pump
VLLVQKEFGFLGKVYSSSAVLMPLVLLALKQQGAGLRAVWDAFVAFQAIRVVILNGRVHLRRERAPAPA